MIILGVLAGVGIIFLIIGLVKSENDTAINTGVFFLVITTVCGAIMAITYCKSINSNAALIAFKTENFDAYKIVAEKTERMTVGQKDKTESAVMIKSEHLQQAPEAARRWAELRNAIEWYNTQLRSKKAYYQNWFLKQWIAEPPDLPFITIETK